MEKFSLITWNISLGQSSIQAPEWWDTKYNINVILDEIEHYQPDFICLQEMPLPEFTELILDQYISSTPALSHSGYTTVFIKRTTVANQKIRLDSQFSLQGASGMLIYINNTPLIIFSLHLPPYKNNAGVRLQYIKDLFRQLPDTRLILAGDMNMRESETDVLINNLKIIDSYKFLNPGKTQYATWDSTINLFNMDNYPFRARFDRIFCRDLLPLNYKLIGNKVQSSKAHFLSDHFGIYCEFTGK